ncbi:hypothetical protein [uncultured Bacteroides sp.]|uniref:hypothetical protein n=1 Tax=uncultured Bacteroides sp. TaxID=162156 RepID=UPI002AA909B8|nr:hypothetical protein [uncultured Bacteroides sp.]
MRIYNYLFYNSFLLAKRSKNFDDIPVLGGISYVIGCLTLNLFTIIGLFDALGINIGIEFKKEYKYIFSLSLVLLLLLYYSYKGRYKKIINKYEKEYKNKKQLHPVITIIIYYLISFGLLLLAGMYKNHNWIFS